MGLSVHPAQSPWGALLLHIWRVCTQPNHPVMEKAGAPDGQRRQLHNTENRSLWVAALTSVSSTRRPPYTFAVCLITTFNYAAAWKTKFYKMPMMQAILFVLWRYSPMWYSSGWSLILYVAEDDPELRLPGSGVSSMCHPNYRTWLSLDSSAYGQCVGGRESVCLGKRQTHATAFLSWKTWTNFLPKLEAFLLDSLFPWFSHLTPLVALNSEFNKYLASACFA